MEIIDNFLDQKEFNELRSLFYSTELHNRNTGPFDWYYSEIVDYDNEPDKFTFVHVFYYNNSPQSQFIEQLNPILNKINPLAIFRIKANLLTKTPNIIENSFHADINLPEKRLKQWTTSVFYMNTNNGYTKFEDGTKVESVANRMLSFPSNMKHTGTSCTDEKVRIVINFNYFKWTPNNN